MQLTGRDKPWAPAEKPDYLCLLRQDQGPPANREAFLDNQVYLLRRLLEQANQGELAAANRQLEQGLPEEFLMSLPTDLLANPQTPRCLLENPAQEGGQLHQWKVGADEALKGPAMDQVEVWEEARGLSLESFLSRLV